MNNTIMDDKGLPDFKGKVVLFYIQNAPPACENGIMMEYIRFEKIGGKLLLTGRIPQISDEDWLANCQSTLAWDAVFHYIEFKNLQDYKDRASQYKPTFLERLKR